MKTARFFYFLMLIWLITIGRVNASESLEYFGSAKAPLVNSQNNGNTLGLWESKKRIEGMPESKNEFANVSFWILDDPKRFEKHIWLQLWIEPKKGWHTYWKNPGGSGVAPKIEAHLGSHTVEASEWIYPRAKHLQGSVNEKVKIDSWGYDEPVLFMAPIERKKINIVNEIISDVGVSIEYGICQIQCVIEKAQWQLDYPTNVSMTIPEQAQWDKWEQMFDVNALDLSEEKVNRLTIRVIKSEAVQKRVTLRVSDDVRPLEGKVRLASALGWSQNEWVLNDLGEFSVDLKSEQLDGLSLNRKLDWQWIDTSGQKSVALNQDAKELLEVLVKNRQESEVVDNVSKSVGSVLFLALLAGMLLNIMPCVFPVLGFKVMGLMGLGVRQRIKELGAYGAGVLISFLSLGALVMLIREAGGYLGWGFQLQNVYFVVFLIILYTLIGFWFMGWVPEGIIGRMQTVGSEWVDRTQGGLKSFAVGILSVVVAAPCAAPFMGASVGVALTSSVPMGMGIFAALGLGMWLPMVLLSFVKRLHLPKPGVWLRQVQTIFGFLMFATVVWLLDVLSGQVASIFWILMILLSISMLLWAVQIQYGWFKISIMCLVVVWSLYAVVEGYQGIQEPKKLESVSVVKKYELFEPWSEQVELQALERGELVFIDFTAKWCITCQINKKAVMETEDFKMMMSKNKVRLLRADWTKPNAQIVVRLRESKRAAVPTYILKSKDQEVLLPEILTVSGINDILISLKEHPDIYVNAK